MSEDDSSLPLHLRSQVKITTGSSYPVYETTYGNAFGYNKRARANMKKMNYNNAYDMNPLNTKLGDLKFTIPSYRKDWQGHRCSYRDAEELVEPQEDESDVPSTLPMKILRYVDGHPVFEDPSDTSAPIDPDTGAEAEPKPNTEQSSE